MVLFLTSSPTGPLDGSRPVDGLDTMNRFRENLAKYWPGPAACLIISASPDAFSQNDGMTDFFRDAFRRSGFAVARFDLMDRRYSFTAEEIQSYDVIILGGGHVPTQNEYFHSIGLREAMEGFDGIVMGISAGTMNSAETVYVEPEEPGEATDPHFRRYLHGLGLTETKVIPHFQMVRDQFFDGISFADANYGYSIKTPMLALTDGAYLLIADGEETVWGEAWWISNGEPRLVCSTDETLPMTALR